MVVVRGIKSALWTAGVCWKPEELSSRKLNTFGAKLDMCRHVFTRDVLLSRTT